MPVTSLLGDAGHQQHIVTSGSHWGLGRRGSQVPRPCGRRRMSRGSQTSGSDPASSWNLGVAWGRVSREQAVGGTGVRP